MYRIYVRNKDDKIVSLTSGGVQADIPNARVIQVNEEQFKFMSSQSQSNDLYWNEDETVTVVEIEVEDSSPEIDTSLMRRLEVLEEMVLDDILRGDSNV